MAAPAVFGAAPASAAARPASSRAPVDHIDPRIGTEAGHGGMVPTTTAPFGMTQWTPMTRENYVSKRPYGNADDTIIGFLGTHQPAIWMGDYGYVAVMPGTGTVRPSVRDRGLRFSHDAETTRGYAYSVDLRTDAGGALRTEITATSRAGFLRFTFPGGEPDPHVVVQATRSGITGNVHVDPERREITGWNPDRQDRDLGPLKLPNFRGYFVARFDTRFASYGTASGAATDDGSAEATAEETSAYVRFPGGTRQVRVKIGTSFISVEQARENLRREIPGWSHERATARLRRTWARKLGAVELDGAAEDERAIFYTGMFHALQYPCEFSEYGRYYSGFDDSVHRGVSYTAYSLWDTFRAETAFLTLFAPERIDDMVTSLLNDYREGGWMPMWPNPSYTNIMIGTHADSVVAEALVKGFRGFDMELAWEAVRKDATVPPDRDTELRFADREEHTPYEARAGLTYLEQVGYVPADKTAEAASRTLEYCYDDYATARVAEAAGRHDDAAFFHRRSKNYRLLYNRETGFMQARNLDGSWADGGWTEGNEWTYTFAVQHDPEGLMELMGRDHFTGLLDRHFAEAHNDHGNEPSHHYPYLFTTARRPWKTQERVRAIGAGLYANTTDGLAGDDDCGQMSAWYILSALGFYPVNPASGRYVLGSPFFTRARVRFPGGRTLVVEAPGNSLRNRYVRSVRLNGRELREPSISHADLLRGGRLVFEMGPVPSNWCGDGTAPRTADVAFGAATETPEAVDGLAETYANVVRDLTVDLGETFTVDRIGLFTDATAYALKVSTDGTTWTTVATEAPGDGTRRTHRFPAMRARYVLLDATGRVRALEVYAKDGTLG